jgi:hypothetical protein
MSREQLMHTWAESVAEGREEPLPMAPAPIKALGYDVNLERQRLEFEMKKFEEETSWRRKEKEEMLAREKKRERRDVSAGKERERREVSAGGKRERGKTNFVSITRK